MNFGLSVIIIASTALFILSVFSFIQVNNLKYQLYYIFLASFFSGMLFVVSLASDNQTLIFWPSLVMIHVVTKVVQIKNEMRNG